MSHVPLFEEDEDEKGAIKFVNTTQCKFKYCRKYDANIKDEAAYRNIDLVNETFYACQFCEEAYAVHEECYGGIDKFAKINTEYIDLMRDDYVIPEYIPAYVNEEEEKKIDPWSYIEEETEKRRNKNAGINNQQYVRHHLNPNSTQE